MSFREPLIGLAEAIAWIHQTLPAEEMQAIEMEVKRDVLAGRRPRLLTSAENGQLTSAVYFRLLPGNVATLGGLRAAVGHETSCVRLMKTLVKKLNEEGNNRLVQAIVGKNDQVQHRILGQCGFVLHTDVMQLWSDCSLAAEPATNMPEDLAWIRVQERSPQHLVEVIDATFVDTLDCPILNQLRTTEDVVSGFQDGRSWPQLRHWFLLHRVSDASDIGCLLLFPHSQDVVETVYLGLVPSARGQSWGALLIDKAIRTSQELGARLLVAGVDCANWPALKAYQQHGFQIHQVKSVYFPAQSLT